MYFKVIAFLFFLNTSLFAQSVGKASWYGEKFQGRTTASGEPFNMYAYTAAHRTLPYGTLLTVTNLKNGKSVNVRVNDRGPYKADRIIDLSFQAAKVIGLDKMGVTTVSIHKKGNEPKITPVVASTELLATVASNKDMSSMMEYALMVTDPKNVVKKPIPSAPKTTQSNKVKVQIASFATKQAAEKFVFKEKSKGYHMEILSTYISQVKQRHQVLIVTDSRKAALAIVQSKQYNGAYILR